MDDSPETLSGRFRLRQETFEHGTFSMRIELPRSSEELIDEAEFGKDERLPYWAELWPSARALAREILDQPSLPSQAIELGCGLALPSLALRYRGVEVLATDYYEDALLFARHNARLNGLGELATLLLDWRDPPEDLPRFPLLLAADVLYEERNAAALRYLLPRVLEASGRVLLADPGRVHLDPFLSLLARDGWAVRRLTDRTEPAPAAPGREITVSLIELRASGSVSTPGYADSR